MAQNVSIGDTLQGGIVFYILIPGDMGYDTARPSGLVVAPQNLGQFTMWGCGVYDSLWFNSDPGTNINGADGTAIGTGAQNTIDIVNDCPTNGIAAKLCADLVLNAYSDWYLPSKEELNKLYINKNSIAGLNKNGMYWSSSENTAVYWDAARYAWMHYFYNGSQSLSNKNGSGGPATIAVRSFCFLTSTITKSACTSYTWNGKTYTSSGTYIINKKNGSGCDSIITLQLSIYQLPVVSLSALGSVCEDAGKITLSGGSPNGGTYSGTGVNSGIFDPLAAGPGTWTITYTYTSNGCSNSASKNIVVKPTPIVTLADFNDLVCENTASFALTGGSPLGGVYSGTGVNSGSFNPAAAGNGPHKITYSYTSNGCSNTTSKYLIVDALPIVSIFPFNSVCTNTSSFILSGGSPAGGTYSGAGVNGLYFDPATAGTGTHTITYTVTGSSGCDGFDTSTISVFICTNVDEQDKNKLNFNISPNPSDGKATLSFTLLKSENLEIKIAGIDGKIRKEIHTSKCQAESNSIVIDTSDFESGIYFISIRSENINKALKLVISH